MSLATNIPKSAIVLPSNVRVTSVGGTMVLQKIKRRTKRYKMSKAQRNKIAAAARKFKVPLLTTMAVGPAVFLSLNQALQQSNPIGKIQVFFMELLSYYTGIRVGTERVRFMPERLAIGWGPVIAVGVAKSIARGRITAINRALGRAQIPANLS